MSGLDPSVPAVILKLDPNPFHHGTLGAIRTLGRWGVPVVALLDSLRTPVATSRYLAHRKFPAKANVPDLLDQLDSLARPFNRQCVLVPTDDQGAILVAEHADRLRGSYLLPDQPPSLPRTLANKEKLADLCRDAGLAQPVNARPASTADLRTFVRHYGLPVVVKAARPWELARPGPLPSTTIVPTAADLARLFAVYAENGQADNLMLQQYLPRGQDWFVHAYIGSGTHRLVFTGVKRRSYPTAAGLTTMGQSRDNPHLYQTVTDLLETVGYRGIVDVDARLDPATGQYMVLDCNPRLGAQFRVFQDTTALDVVQALHRDLTGRWVEPGRMSRRTFLVENYDVLACIEQMRQRRLSPQDWWRSIRATDELAWFSTDDPAPFASMSARFAQRGGRKLACHLRAATPLTHWIDNDSGPRQGAATEKERMT